VAAHQGERSIVGGEAVQVLSPPPWSARRRQGKGAFVRDPLPEPGQVPDGQQSEAYQAVMAEIRALHDDLDRFAERLARVERLVLPGGN